MTLNNKPLYPFTYGDLILDDEERLSNFIVEITKNKKVQNVASVIFWTTLTLGGQANAMPPEAGEYVANVAAGAEQNPPPLGEIAGSATAAANPNLAAHNPIQGVTIPQQQHYANLNPPIQNKPVKYNFPGPPQTVVGQRINTGASLMALAFICLQGYWGDPVFMWGCAGMVIRFLLKTGNIENL